jgi:hypothetical protein
VKVYLIGSSEGFYKIGVASNPSSRLSQLDSTRLPFELTLLAEYDAGEAARQVESKLHRHFKAKHKRGEWFWMVSRVDFLLEASRFHREYIAPEPREQKPRKKVGELNAMMEDNLMCERLLAYCNQLQVEETK